MCRREGRGGGEPGAAGGGGSRAPAGPPAPRTAPRTVGACPGAQPRLADVDEHREADPSLPPEGEHPAPDRPARHDGDDPAAPGSGAPEPAAEVRLPALGVPVELSSGSGPTPGDPLVTASEAPADRTAPDSAVVVGCDDTDTAGTSPVPGSRSARPRHAEVRAGWDAWWGRLPTSPASAWVATGIATVVAAVLRLVGLDRIPTLIFDETYYVKDAYSLAHLGYEGTWEGGSDLAFAHGDFSALTLKGSFIVHPPTGKWLIAAGMQVFGPDNPVGWRISAVVAGTVGVFLLCRLAWNLFRSPAVTLVAGLFLATDGMHLVMSRTSLLDIFLSTFVLAAFLAVVKDQQQAHPRLVSGLRAWRGPEEPDPGGLGPHSGSRWWLLVAGVLLGLACSVKWSGIYALAVLGLFVALREWTTRRRLGHPRALRAALALDVPMDFLALVPTAIVVYILSWTGWMVHPRAWGHGVSAASGGPSSGLLAVMSDLWAYHRQMWTFHNGLTTPHNYQSHPAGWLLQLRPTSFAYEKISGGCAGGNCVRNVVALGNPALWWLAVPALVVALWAVFRCRNWRVGLILCGYLAMYVPWFAYSHRTIFTFYTVAFVPFVALVLAWALGLATGQCRLRDDPDEEPRPGGIGGADPGWLELPRPVRSALALSAPAVVVVVLLTSAYFYTVWTGVLIPYQEWLSRMWLHSWI